MKLRVRGDSLRLRLTQGEVSALRQGEPVEEMVGFGPGASLRYVLRRDGAAVQVTATFSNGQISVDVPATALDTWADSDQIGIEAQQAIDGSRVLELLIEKDFRCLTPRGEGDEDAFPNPAAADGGSY